MQKNARTLGSFEKNFCPTLVVQHAEEQAGEQAGGIEQTEEKAVGSKADRGAGRAAGRGAGREEKSRQQSKQWVVEQAGWCRAGRGQVYSPPVL